MNVPSEEASRSLREIDTLVRGHPGNDALLEVCRWLRGNLPRYRWVGIYVLHGEVLDLAAWDGPAATEHTRIPVGRGVCGRAVREGRTILVDDVRSAPEYLACFRETRAEIVVPIRTPHEILGEIDIDANEVAAFDGSDQAFLERVAERLTAILDSERERPSPPA